MKRIFLLVFFLTSTLVEGNPIRVVKGITQMRRLSIRSFELPYNGVVSPVTAGALGTGLNTALMCPDIVSPVVAGALGSEFDIALTCTDFVPYVAAGALVPEHDIALTPINVANKGKDVGHILENSLYSPADRSPNTEVSKNDMEEVAKNLCIEGLHYCSQGDYAKALEYFGKALFFCKQVFGSYHPITKQVKMGMEVCRKKMQD